MTLCETVTCVPRQRRERAPSASTRSAEAVASTRVASPAASLSDLSGELAEDPRDLFTLGAFGLAKAIRRVDDGERFDEERLTRARAVVDDPGNGAPRRGAQREHRPSGPLRDEVLGEMVFQVGVACKLFQPLGKLCPTVAELASQATQRRGRIVANIAAVILDRVGDRVGDDAEIEIDRSDELGKRRPVAVGESGAPDETGSDRVADAAQRGRVECRRPGRRAPRRRDVVEEPEIWLGSVVEHGDRLGGEALAMRDLVGLGGRPKRAGQTTTGLARRGVSESVEDRRQLEQLERTLVHRCRLDEPRGLIRPDHGFMRRCGETVAKLAQRTSGSGSTGGVELDVWGGGRWPWKTVSFPGTWPVSAPASLPATSERSSAAVETGLRGDAESPQGVTVKLACAAESYASDRR